MKMELTDILRRIQELIWEMFPLTTIVKQSVNQNGSTGILVTRKDVAANDRMEIVGGIHSRPYREIAAKTENIMQRHAKKSVMKFLHFLQ